MAVARVVAQAELPDDVVANASLAEVLLAVGDAVGAVMQRLFKVVGSPFVDDEHRLAF